MTLVECMDKLTHREFRVRLAWLDSQWNKPSKLDHYLMKLIAYLARLPGGELRDPSAYQVRFGSSKKNPVEEGEARQRNSRNVWNFALGGKKKSNGK